MRSRRRFLSAASGLAAAALLSPRASAQLTRTPLNNMPEIVRRLTGGAAITPGRVKLDVPPLVENGHLVPLGVTVESPMTASDYVSDTENVVAIARMSDGSYWSDTAFVIVTMAACLEEL
jgi:sulfur-oxidizing protein SoxY